MTSRRSNRKLHCNVAENGNEWLSEEEIKGKGCDHEKTYCGYRDDNKYAEPYRHITNWFLTTKPEHIHSRRKSLPEQNKLQMRNLYLFGEIISKRQKCYKVQIHGLKTWAFDRHFEDRGIWVQSRNAWYKLEQPSTDLIALSDGSQTSQDILHQPLRAKIGLLSNIIDMMSFSDPFVKKYSKMSPLQSYHAICLTDEETQINPKICDVPFDVYLLRRDPLFVKKHLKDWNSRLSQTCPFMKGLTELSTILKLAKKKKEQWALEDFDYSSSAKDAEERSNRYPWGCPRLDAEEKWTSRLTELIDFKFKSVPVDMYKRVQEPVKHVSNIRGNKRTRHSGSNSSLFQNTAEVISISDKSSHCSDTESSKNKKHVKREKLTTNSSDDENSIGEQCSDMDNSLSSYKVNSSPSWTASSDLDDDDEEDLSFSIINNDEDEINLDSTSDDDRSVEGKPNNHSYSNCGQNWKGKRYQSSLSSAKSNSSTSIKTSTKPEGEEREDFSSVSSGICSSMSEPELPSIEIDLVDDKDDASAKLIDYADEYCNGPGINKDSLDNLNNGPPKTNDSIDEVDDLLSLCLAKENKSFANKIIPDNRLKLMERQKQRLQKTKQLDKDEEIKKLKAEKEALEAQLENETSKKIFSEQIPRKTGQVADSISNTFQSPGESDALRQTYKFSENSWPSSSTSGQKSSENIRTDFEWNQSHSSKWSRYTSKSTYSYSQKMETDNNAWKPRPVTPSNGSSSNDKVYDKNSNENQNENENENKWGYSSGNKWTESQRDQMTSFSLEKAPPPNDNNDDEKMKQCNVDLTNDTESNQDENSYQLFSKDSDDTEEEHDKRMTMRETASEAGTIDPVSKDKNQVPPEIIHVDNNDDNADDKNEQFSMNSSLASQPNVNGKSNDSDKDDNHSIMSQSFVNENYAEEYSSLTSVERGYQSMIPPSLRSIICMDTKNTEEEDKDPEQTVQEHFTEKDNDHLDHDDDDNDNNCENSILSQELLPCKNSNDENDVENGSESFHSYQCPYPSDTLDLEEGEENDEDVLETSKTKLSSETEKDENEDCTLNNSHVNGRCIIS